MAKLFLLNFVFVVLMTADMLGEGAGAAPKLRADATPADRDWATHLSNQAAQGDAEAQFHLSQALMDGHVFAQSLPESVKWLRASAEQGQPEAEANMGGFYFLGQGLPQDDSKAVYWSQKAADHGNVNGEYNLGFMYALGRGVKKNDEQAVHWYLKSAEQGHPAAAYGLGVAYWFGVGSSQDPVKGYMWFLLAQHFGFGQGKQAVDKYGPQLGSAKISEARRRESEWLKAHPNVKTVPL